MFKWLAIIFGACAGRIRCGAHLGITATFRILFVLIVLSHDRRRILYFHVTEHPTAAWTARQLLEARGTEETPRYSVRGSDGVYGRELRPQVTTPGINEVPTAHRSAWQNPYAERVIGSIRRECLDHVVILRERHPKRILSGCTDYYHRVRTHLALEKDAPYVRPTQISEEGRVVEFKCVGGLHHEYVRVAA